MKNAIKNACEKTGFEPVIIDEQHIDSEITINDAIIASLKKSKFCIADFSLQRNGVYFESGFALGQGKKVIYTCSSEDWDNLHFDVNHFQLIKYSTPAELENSLINRIEAIVK